LNIERLRAQAFKWISLRRDRRCGRSRFERGRVSCPQKEKPGGGNAGSDFFVIGVYGFKYAAWLSFMPPEGGEAVVLLVQPILFFFFCFLVLRLRL
jgi:hypothetical protein